ncbi:MAG: hypothetical protein WCX29_02205 [Candidatus Peribacteraceae bacterium]|nr:hypothetical protein [Candidatus Peribacteria bacterium]
MRNSPIDAFNEKHDPQESHIAPEGPSALDFEREALRQQIDSLKIPPPAHETTPTLPTDTVPPKALPVAQSPIQLEAPDRASRPLLPAATASQPEITAQAVTSGTVKSAVIGGAAVSGAIAGLNYAAAAMSGASAGTALSLAGNVGIAAIPGAFWGAGATYLAGVVHNKLWEHPGHKRPGTLGTFARGLVAPVTIPVGIVRNLTWNRRANAPAS